MASDLTGNSSDLPSLSIRRPILVIVMNLLIVLGGVAALLGVEVRELPNVDRPVVSVRVRFPGASPETMDAEVISTLEGAAARVPGVRSIRAASEETTGRVHVEFYPDIDLNSAANDLREAVSEVERSLPPGVEEVVVIKADDDAQPIIRLSIFSPELSIDELTSIVEEQVIPEYLSIPGVADARLFGNQRRQLNVVVDPARMANYRLSVTELAGVLASTNLDVPAGSFAAAEQDLMVRADASVVEEGAVERIVVRGTTRIGDVANVFFGPADAISYARLNGQPIIGLGIVRQARSNTIEISDGVNRVTERLTQRLKTVQIVNTSDDAVFIRGAIREVLFTLSMGILIVVTVILLFIGSPRATLVPALAIPIALVGTLAAIWLLGFSVNLLTLLAMVLATGLVVDDAIVVLENIERLRRRGVPHLAAAVLGTRQVFFAVIATTTTLVSVFVPIAFLPGTIGQLFREFGVVLAVSVSISSFVALSIVPMLAARLPDQTAASPGRLRRWLLESGAGLRDFYIRSLGACIAAPLRVGAVALALAAAVGSLFLALERELVPPEDRGVLPVFMRGPDGVNLDYTDRQVTQVEDLLAPLVEQGEATGVLAIIGRYDPSVGFVLAPLAPWDERERSQLDIARELRPALEQIPGVRASISRPNSLNLRSSGTEVEFALIGNDYARLADVGERFVKRMEERLPELRDPVMEFAPTQPQLSIELDRERASDLGVDIYGVATTLQAMVEGYEVTQINVRDESVPVVIRSAYGAVNDTDDLQNLFLSATDGRLVPLSAIASVTEGGIAAQLDRRGQRRAVEIEAQLADGVAIGEAVAALEALAADELPGDVGLLLLGEAEALKEAGQEVAITFAIATIVVLLVLAAQFENFASALVVMVTVPFGLAAAVLALWLTGTSLNVYSQIGLIMLVGLMAKNGILIVEFADQLRERGLAPREAALRAAGIRLRPVMMTMLSTILGGVPLILSGGPGSEARGAIGWVIFGGLGFAIVSTIYLTPVAYAVLAPLGRSRSDFARRLARQLAAVQRSATRRSAARQHPPPARTEP